MTRTPVLFVSHGSPMFALDPGSTGPALSAWVQAHAPASSLKGIVIMSPHWMTNGIGVMAAPEPETLHDFGGFPDALYQLQYPAKGDPELARRVWALMQKADLACAEDLERPLDHGAWIPLRQMYPQAMCRWCSCPCPPVRSPRTFMPWVKRWYRCDNKAF